MTRKHKRDKVKNSDTKPTPTIMIIDVEMTDSNKNAVKEENVKKFV